MPRKKTVKTAGKAATSKLKTTFNSKRKLALLLTFVIITSGVFLILLIPGQVAVDQNSTGALLIGTVQCSVELETQPLQQLADGSYAPIYTATGDVSYDADIAVNAPFFVGEQEIAAMDFVINIVAVGNYIDWSTLSIEVTATTNGIVVGTKTIPESPLARDEGGFIQIVSFRITDFDTYIDIDLPDNELTDGTLIYNLDCIAVANGFVNDAKGNNLEDVVSINQIWTVNSLPDGSFSMIGSEELVKPSFESAPQATKINQGEYLPLHWVVYDDNPTNYIIRTYTTGDGSHVVQEGTWNAGDIISYLSAGSYASIELGDIDLYISCTIFDGNGQQEIHSVLIEIIVPVINLAPTFEKGDSIYTTTSGAAEVFLTYRPRSDYPSSYIIYQNSDEIESGTWVGGDIIVYADFLYAGINDFKCVVIDTSSRSAFYTHTILTPVIDEANPGVIIDLEPQDPDAGIINAPFSLGDIQGISLFAGFFFVGVGISIWYIMKKRGK